LRLQLSLTLLYKLIFPSRITPVFAGLSQTFICFFIFFFGVPHLATCIFLFFYNEPELGAGSGKQTNPRKTNPANRRKWQSPCYSGKKIGNWHICEIVEMKMAKSVL